MLPKKLNRQTQNRFLNARNSTISPIYTDQNVHTENPAPISFSSFYQFEIKIKALR